MICNVIIWIHYMVADSGKTRAAPLNRPGTILFPYYGIQPYLYGYGLWCMERSIRIILFHNIMDRMPGNRIVRKIEN